MIILIILAVLIGGIWALRTRHVARRREERRCRHWKDDKPEWVCCDFTTRHYLMVSDDQGRTSRWGKWFQPYVIDVCPDCHYTSVPKDPKFFNQWELAWRHFWNQEQFLYDEYLLEMAGIIPKAIPPTMDRVRKHAEDDRERAGRLRAKLDKPPESELRVYIFMRTNVPRISASSSSKFITAKPPKG